MPIHSLTKEKYEQLLKEVETKTSELESIRNKKPVDMYKEDLAELRKSLNRSTK
jgi:cobalamin biosynthesis Co2+ chelatase CbiK